LLIYRKDWRELRRNWQIILPMATIPFLFSVLLPTLIMIIPTLTSAPTSPSEDFASVMANLPSHIRNELAGMTPQQALVYMMSLYFFAPFFLIIPLMAASVVAADSFAGEKERKTVEALLATPLADSELLLGKILVSFIPSMAVTVISFLTYSTVVNVISSVLLGGRILLPNLVWLMLILGLSPSIAIAAIGLTVIISARVKGVREAQQISALLLIPIFVLMFGQLSGAVIVGPVLIAGLIGVFILVDAVVFHIGVRLFKREEILSRLP